MRAGAGARWAVGQALTALGAGWATLIHCQHLAAHRSWWRSGCDQEEDASMVVLGHLCKTRHCCGCQQEKQCWRRDSSVPQHGHQTLNLGPEAFLDCAYVSKQGRRKRLLFQRFCPGAILPEVRLSPALGYQVQVVQSPHSPGPVGVPAPPIHALREWLPFLGGRGLPSGGVMWNSAWV